MYKYKRQRQNYKDKVLYSMLIIYLLKLLILQVPATHEYTPLLQAATHRQTSTTVTRAETALPLGAGEPKTHLIRMDRKIDCTPVVTTLALGANRATATDAA